MFSHSPLMKVLSYLLYSFLMLLGFFVCKNLYDKIKNEEHREKGKVVQTIIKNHCLIQIIAWPSISILFILICLNNETFHFMDSSKTLIAIHMVRYLYFLFRNYLSFHSLIVAITRYSFLMYDVQTEIIGIRKLRNLFISCSIGVPFIQSIFYVSTEAFQMRWLLLFKVQNYSMSEPPKQHDITNIQITEAEEYNIFLFNIIRKTLPSSLLLGLQYFGGIIFCLIFSNIIEGFLYTHLFVHFHRYFVNFM